jgi:hypothetical protein
MSIPISQKVDLLYKQAFGVTKTDTEANKSPSNESIASPLLIRGDTLWSQADQIPGVGAAVTDVVTAYTGTGAAECTADNTTVPVGGVYPTWKTSLTYWIPAEFGSTYSVGVWVDDAGVADPTSTGTQIFGAGSGGTGEFFYNYQSGVLNFIGETIPTALTSTKVLYIVGYRYIGLTGVSILPDTQIGNLDITDQTVTGQDTDANIVLTPNGTGQVVTSGNITASYFYGNGAFLTGIDATGIQNGTSNVRIPVADGNVELNVNGGLTANVTDTGIVMTSGNLDLGNVIATGVGTFTGNVAGGNLTSGGVVEVTGNVIGGNLTTVGLVSATGNVAGGNITTAGVVEATGNVSGANLTSGGVVEVTGNVIGGNITTVGVVAATGNVSGGNLTTAGAADITGNLTAGNVDGGNLVQASFFTGTLIDGTSNITITNNGNIDLVSAGNTTAVISGTGANIVGTVNANGVATLGSVVTAQITGAGSGNLTLTAGSSDDYVEIRPTGTGQVHVGGFKIESLGAPTASTDAATKQYVDDVAQGLSVQAPAIVASTGTYAAMSTGTVTYDNGTAGVGATLTTTVALTAIDGITLTVNDRIIIKDETGANLPNNGIYVYTSSTVLTRAADFDTPTEMAGGDFCFVQQGTTYNDTGWVMTDPVTTVGTSDVTWVQFSGAGSFTAGAGLTLTGTVFSVNTDNLTTDISGGNVVVKTSAQLTTPNIGAATGTSLTATGNVAGGNITTAGVVSATGNVIGGNVTTGGVVSAVGNISGGNVAGTTGTFTDIGGSLTTAAQPNVTSVGTLTSLTVTGNTSSGNLSTGGTVSATGNVSGGNITTAGVVDATGNVSGANLTTAGVVAATGNVSGGNITTGAKVVAVGNIDTTSGIFNGDGYGISNIAAGNIVGLNLSGISNGTSNVDIATADGNITMSVDSTGNVAVITATGLVVTGTAGVSGTVTAPAFTANTGIFTGNGSGLTALTGANVTGEVTFAATANAVAGANVSGQVANALVSGTVYTAAQPNITSVGTLTSVVVSGDANIAGEVRIGASEISTIAAATVTTSTTSQTALATFAISGINGIEFLVKGVDATSGNVSVATVLSVTDGSTVDFSVYGQAFLTGPAGTLAVGINGADLELLVTPAATDSTVWTTQYRFI